MSKTGPLAFSEILDLLRRVLERIEWVAGGWSLTFVLAQRESHWCLTTQTCLLLLFYSSSTPSLVPINKHLAQGDSARFPGQTGWSKWAVKGVPLRFCHKVLEIQVDFQVDFQVSQGPSKGVPPRICQKVLKTDTFASRIRIKRDPLHFQKFRAFSGSC